MERTSRAALAFTFALLVAPALLGARADAAPLPQGYHTDARFGFKFRPPKKWTAIPVQAQDQWLVAKYLSDKKYFYTEDDGWTYEHQPELMVIAFVEAVVNKEGKKISKVENGERITFQFDNPYKDYEDYLDRNYHGGGFYIAEREEDQIGDVAVTKLDIRVEKLARGGPKRVITWIFHAPAVDFAVQTEVLENHYDKLKRTIEGVLRSFKLIPRTEGELPTEAVAPGGWVTIFDMDEGTPEERRKKRQESATQLRQKALDNLPDDWTAEQMGRVFVISHVDRKYAEKLADQSNALLDWFDQTFAFIGPDEYVRDPILRVCKDDEEEYAYRRGGQSGGGWFTIGIEITTNPGKNDWTNFENEWINKRLLGVWFQDRDRDLYWALPEWLDYGLQEYVADLFLKGKKLEAKPDDWDKGRLRDLVRADSAASPRELIKMTRESFHDATSMWSRMEEAGALVRFLLSDKGQKKKQTRDVLVDYMKNLQQVIAQIEKEDDKDGKKIEKPKTEEEEEELYKKRRDGWKEKERQILDETFARTFGDWSDRDWENFEKDYLDSID